MKANRTRLKWRCYFKKVKPVLKPNLPKRLFWEFRYEDFDWQKGASIVIERVAERGSAEEWEEMIKFYGFKKSKTSLKRTRYLNDRAIAKVCDYFNLRPEDLRSYRRKQTLARHWY